MRDKRTTSEDRATQLLICEALSLAIMKNIEDIDGVDDDGDDQDDL